MKRILGVVAIVAGIAVLVVVLAAFFVPRLLDRPEVRARISSGAREFTGRELSWERLDVAWLPPAFEVIGARLEPAAHEAPILAERVALRVSPWPLFAGVIAIDSLTVEGVSVEVVRTRDGIALPFALPEQGDARDEPAEPAVDASADAGGDGTGAPISLAVRRVSARDIRIAVHDRSLAEPATLSWVIDEARATGGASPDAPIPFSFAGTLDGGGRFDGSGSASLAGDWKLAVAVAGLELAPLAPWVPETAIEGRADVEIEAAGDGGDLSRATLKLAGHALRAVRDDLEVAGDVPLSWSATARPEGGLEGPLSVDLTAARVSRGDTFRKPAGDALAIEGPLAWDGNGAFRLGPARVELPGVVATVSVETAPATVLHVDAPLFDPSRVAAWLPALADVPIDGRVGFESWRVGVDPLSLGGGMHIDAMTLPLEAGETARVTGMLEGQGSALVGNGLAIDVAGQAITANVRLEGLDTKPVVRLDAEGRGLVTETLLHALGADQETLSGPLDFDADLVVPLASGASPLDLARGTATWSIAPGRVKGVSLLRSTFDTLGSFTDVALLAGKSFGGKTLQRFYGDAFDRASATLRLSDGIVRTDDLRLDYRDYRAELAGTVRLADRALDMRGQLVLFETIDRALADASGAPAPQTARAVDRVIPLAAVSGTLDDPKVDLTRAAVVALTESALDRGGRLDRVRQKVDDKLGTGAGDAVIDVLEGILGGRKRR